MRRRAAQLPTDHAATPAAHKAYVAWVKAGYDLNDYERITGPFYRRDTNEHAELAINAGGERWRFQKRLTGKDLASHRAAAITLRAAPVKTSGTIRVRLDADAHHGQPDAREAILWLAARYLPGLYHEASDRGHAGYMDLELPRLPWRGAGSPNGDGTYCPSAADINAQVDQLQQAMAKQLAAVGFTCTFEINGRLERRARNHNGTRRILSRGMTGKLPRCQHDNDVAKLVASRYPWSAMEKILRDAREVVAQTAPSPMTPALAPQVARPRVQHEPLTGTGDKNRNRWNCCRLAALPYLGTVESWQDLPDRIQAKLRATARTLYEEARFAGGEHDQDRERSFESKFVRLFATYDPAATGTGTGGGIWFDETVDVKAAEQLLRSKVSKRTLAALQTTKVRGRISYRGLAHLLCCIAKTANSAHSMYNRADVPQAAMISFMAFFGFHVNGSFVHTAVELFESLGLIAITRSYHVGHYCRRFEIRGKARGLPFVAHLYQVELKAEQDAIAQRQSQRYLQHHPCSNPILSFCNRMKGSTSATSNHASQPDDGYWTGLDDLGDEYDQRARLMAA